MDGRDPGALGTGRRDSTAMYSIMARLSAHIAAVIVDVGRFSDWQEGTPGVENLPKTTFFSRCGAAKPLSCCDRGSRQRGLAARAAKVNEAMTRR